MKIQIVADWRRVLRHAWSIRFLALSILFGGLEVGFAALSSNPPIPAGVFAALSFLTTVLSGVFKFISQKEFRTDGDD